MEGKICPPEGFMMGMMKDDLLRVKLMVGRRRHGGDLASALDDVCCLREGEGKVNDMKTEVSD